MTPKQKKLHIGLSYCLFIVTILSLLVIDKCGKIHCLLLFILFVYGIVAQWKTDNNILGRLRKAIYFPLFELLVIAISFTITPYISEFALVSFPGRANGWQLTLFVLIVVILMINVNLALLRHTKIISIILLITTGIILSMRLYSLNPVFITVWLLLISIFLSLNVKKDSLLIRLQKEACSLYKNPSKLSDKFWLSCINNPKLSMKEQLSAFRKIKDEELKTELLLSKKPKLLSITKSPLDYIKKWENRIRLLPILSESEIEEFLLSCTDITLLQKIIKQKRIHLDFT